MWPIGETRERNEKSEICFLYSTSRPLYAALYLYALFLMQSLEGNRGISQKFLGSKKMFNQIQRSDYILRKLMIELPA